MDLSLVSLEDIINELDARSDGLVVGLLYKKDKNLEVTRYHYRGGKIQALGLVTHIHRDILDESVESLSEIIEPEQEDRNGFT